MTLPDQQFSMTLLYTKVSRVFTIVKAALKDDAMPYLALFMYDCNRHDCFVDQVAPITVRCPIALDAHISNLDMFVVGGRLMNIDVSVLHSHYPHHTANW